MTVRARFAPSPTGQVHIGNIRVAIYNWLFARHHGGQFLLRVEDTDRERSTAAAVSTLFQALDWLGLQPDEEPVYQSQRADRHREAAEQLMRSGHAYRARKGEDAGEVVLLRMPGEDMVFRDLVRGELRKAAADLPDFVLVRSNGTPVFHLANVVDDIDQGITHVIRGDDHVENTFRHLALYRALGAPAPAFAHLPMIVNAQGKPYSKRDGDAFVGDFRDKDILPEAIFNYLVLLGWAPGDDRELFTREELVPLFTLDRVHASAAQMDLRKLMSINQHHLARVPDAEFSATCAERLRAAGVPIDAAPADLRTAVFALMRPRLKACLEIVEQAAYFFDDAYPVDEKIRRKRLEAPEAPRLLAFLRGKLAEADFSAPVLTEALHQWPAEAGVAPGDLLATLRAAVTGRPGGPDLGEVLALLGRDTVLRRLDRLRA
jgi:glutamyl-tRNA synthetase